MSRCAAFMTTYQKANAIVEQYNRKLVEWQRAVREKQAPVKKQDADRPKKALKIGSCRYKGRQKIQSRQNTNPFGIDS